MSGGGRVKMKRERIIQVRWRKLRERKGFSSAVYSEFYDFPDFACSWTDSQVVAYCLGFFDKWLRRKCPGGYEIVSVEIKDVVEV